jgi:parallel beta-helix repeat protein
MSSRNLVPGSLLLAAIALTMGLLSARDAQAIAPLTYVVDTTSGVNTLTACTGAANDCSLGGAITASNAHTGTDTPDQIAFNIPNGGQKTITLTQALPAITDTLSIDAFTQPGLGQFGCQVIINGGRCIQINGTNVSAASGLTVSASNVTVRGLALYNFSGGNGILVNSGASNVTLKQNYLGMSNSTTIASNHIDIVTDASTSNVTIGGHNGEGNLISGSSQSGVEIGGKDSVLEGNLIGTDSSGFASAGNPQGVYISGSNNRVGGTVEGAGNVISGNYMGIFLDGIQNTVVGNFIGTGANGLTSLGNRVGIRVDDDQNTIGGTEEGARNIISGNSVLPAIGIQIDAGQTQVLGNYIGTDVTGLQALPNGTGIYVSNGLSNMIGSGDVGGGNVISGNDDSAVVVVGSAETTIAGNLIGPDVTGQTALPNLATAGPGKAAILLDNAPQSMVGGATVAARNVISGNKGVGIKITGTNNQVGSTVMGNYIGIAANGATGMGNTEQGILLQPTNTSAPVRGNAISGNVISGNGPNIFPGITLEAAGFTGADVNNNQIYGNIIGLDAAGDAAFPNYNGIYIHAENGGSAVSNSIGKDGPGGANVISGNTADGIALLGDGVDGTLIRNNFIGTNAAGDAPIGNGSNGIFIGAGGSHAIENNTIGGHQNAYGIRTSSEGTYITGNYIGTNASGDAGLGNVAGVFVSSSNNAVGGSVTGPAGGPGSGPGEGGNVIRNNITAGVWVESGTGNTIAGNSIDTNGGLGIRLMAGANNDPAPPSLTSAESGNGKTTIAGALFPALAPTYFVQFFSSPACDASGGGEGRNFIGQITIVPSSSPQEFEETFNTGALGGTAITATVTDDAGNTSQFSQCVTATTTATPTPSPTPSRTPTPTPSSSVTPTPTGVLGDADCSGTVDMNDVLAALSDFAGVEPGADCQDNADADCDGDVDPLDALRIARYAADVPLPAASGCGQVGT